MLIHPDDFYLKSKTTLTFFPVIVSCRVVGYGLCC